MVIMQCVNIFVKDESACEAVLESVWAEHASQDLLYLDFAGISELRVIWK